MGLAMATSRPRDRINSEHDGKTLLFLYIHVEVRNPTNNYYFSYVCEIDFFFFFSKTRRGVEVETELESRSQFVVIERCSYFLETSELN